MPDERGGKVKSPTLSKTESMGHPKTLSLRHPPLTLLLLLAIPT
jgi:hypothetical protein